MQRRRSWVAATIAIAIAASVGASQERPAGRGRPVVHLVPIEGDIDLGLAPFVARVLDEAARTSAALVVLEIDTFGGRVDAAVLIRDALLRSETRTVALIDKRAISAGALIALAAERIAMTEGATIGAAAPVQVGPGGGPPDAAPEKTVSYVRKEFRATAEMRKRPPLLAEAMVDADVEVPGVIERGKLLTLSTDEALELGVADLRCADRRELLARLGLADADVRIESLNWAERLVRVLTHPVTSSLLLTLGILGLITELRTPGFGAPGIVGFACFALFFWGHAIVHLAGWEEVLLFALGVVLLAVEVFVTPGFGAAGIFGIGAILASIVLSLVGAGASADAIAAAVARVIGALVAATAGAAILLRYLPRLPFARRLLLVSTLPAGSGVTASHVPDAPLVGKLGTTASMLRPAGIAEIDGRRVDVVSEGDFIEAGHPIEVVRVDENQVIVRRVERRGGSNP